MSEEIEEMHKELVRDWFSELQRSKNNYSEPILDDTVTNYIKEICDLFRQDTAVFILTVDTIEKYIRIKDMKTEKIINHPMIIVVIMYMCYKNIGTVSFIKIEELQKLLKIITGNIFKKTQILDCEREIWRTLDWTISSTNKVDDLLIVLENILYNLYIKVDLKKICIFLLEMITLQQCKLYEYLKEFYDQTNNHLRILESLMSSKFYLPVTIVLCAFKLTNLKNVINIDSWLNNISTISCIHKDHYLVCLKTMMRLL